LAWYAVIAIMKDKDVIQGKPVMEKNGGRGERWNAADSLLGW
jgi:hypothetical protein